MSNKIKTGNNSKVHFHDHTRSDLHIHADATFVLVIASLLVILYLGAVCLLAVLRAVRDWLMDMRNVFTQISGVVRDPVFGPYYILAAILGVIILTGLALIAFRFKSYISKFFQDEDDYVW